MKGRPPKVALSANDSNDNESGSNRCKYCILVLVLRLFLFHHQSNHFNLMSELLRLVTVLIFSIKNLL
jgi:hypothetical protein